MTESKLIPAQEKLVEEIAKALYKREVNWSWDFEPDRIKNGFLEFSRYLVVEKKLCQLDENQDLPEVEGFRQHMNANGSGAIVAVGTFEHTAQQKMWDDNFRRIRR